MNIYTTRNLRLQGFKITDEQPLLNTDTSTEESSETNIVQDTLVFDKLDSKIFTFKIRSKVLTGFSLGKEGIIQDGYFYTVPDNFLIKTDSEVYPEDTNTETPATPSTVKPYKMSLLTKGLIGSVIVFVLFKIFKPKSKIKT